MAEVDDGDARSSGRTGTRLDPENGRAEAVILLQVTVNKPLDEVLLDVVEFVFEGVLKEHASSVHLLTDLAGRADSEGGVKEEEYQSLAEVLWKAYRGQQVSELADGQPVS